MATELTVFQARVGDRNNLAMAGARSLGVALRSRLGIEPFPVGIPEPALDANWDVELQHARPALLALQDRLEAVYSRGNTSIAATSRCSASIATLPVLVRHHPDACVVWFDAHADLNTPASSTTGYLGGLALSGPVGLWDSGFGAGVSLDNVVLVGQRDVDSFELELMRARGVRHIKPGRDIFAELRAAVGRRAVYVHLDCDVLEPGLVPTEYRCDGGLSLLDLRQAFEALALGDVLGLEVAEFQDAWEANGPLVSPEPLIEALSPVLTRMTG